MTYNAPIQDFRFLLTSVAGLDETTSREVTSAVPDELLLPMFEEAARFASLVLAPINAVGDKEGARLEGHDVIMPTGFKAAYEAWTKGGWNGVDSPEHWGGSGLPLAVNSALMEVWTSACMAFSLGPVLTQAAAHTLGSHGSVELQKAYIPKLVSGEWSAAMAITEPQAGSDLSRIATRASPAEDGTYRIRGQKIFISYGDHDLTTNIVQLVLARLPDGPTGIKGLSLFLVPKFLPSNGDKPCQRNDVVCSALEEKLGVHASPTCTMNYGDQGNAVGWLIGEPHSGLACMFTMMNRARLATGIQGIAIGERALQQAWYYARSRLQGTTNGHLSPIIKHPDVMRMLVGARADLLAARSIALTAAIAVDLCTHPDPQIRQLANDDAAFLTPIVKAFGSEMGLKAASIGIQVHGGMGYIEATGAAQHFRDARIPPIYEGTNGIQAIDLVVRKIVRPGGETARRIIEKMKAMADLAAASGDAEVMRCADSLKVALSDVAESISWLLSDERTEAELLAVATPFLNLFARVLGGALLVKGLGKIGREPGAPPEDYHMVAQYYCECALAETSALKKVVMSGGRALRSGDAALSYTLHA